MKRLYYASNFIDWDVLVRQFAKNCGFPDTALRTPEQVAAFRKRSKSSRKGWKTRRAQKFNLT